MKRLPAAVQEPAASTPPRRALTVEVNDLTEAVLAYAVDPDYVAFGSACPAPELFGLERIRRVLSSTARRDTGALGRYGLPPGTERLRRAIARRALEWGCRHLGPGFLESIYHRAVCVELCERKMHFDEEKAVNVVYKGHVLHGCKSISSWNRDWSWKSRRSPSLRRFTEARSSRI